MHSLPRYVPILRRFALASASALVSFLVSSPLGAFCSTQIDVSSVTNVYFVEYDSFTNFLYSQIAEIDNLTNIVEGQLVILGRLSTSNAYCISSAEQTVSYLLYYNQDQTPYYNSAVSAASHAHGTATEIQALRNDLYEERSTLRSLRTELEGYELPTYQIVVDQYSGGGGSGCSCPDYTEILVAIRGYLSSVSSTLSGISDDVRWSVDILWNFFQQADYGAGARHVEEHYEGQYIGNIFGHVFSNVWASASPQTLQSRIHRYTEYADDYVEPGPGSVATDVPLVAIIGLLYRIQHNQTQTNRTFDVVSTKAEEEMDEAKEEAEDAQEEQQQEQQDVDTDLDVEVTADSGILKLWDELEKFINALDRVLRSSSQTDEFIVLAADGISINLAASRAGSAAVSRPGRVSLRTPGSGNWTTFRTVVRSLCTILWYILGAVIVYFLTTKVFTLVATGVTLAIAIAGGDISGAVTLAERFFHKST